LLRSVGKSYAFLKEYQEMGSAIEPIERPDLVEYMSKNPAYLAHRIQEEQKQFEQTVLKRESQIEKKLEMENNKLNDFFFFLLVAVAFGIILFYAIQ